MQLPLLVYSVRGGLLLVVNSALTVMWSTIMLDEHSARRVGGRCYFGSNLFLQCWSWVDVTAPGWMHFCLSFGILDGRAHTWGHSTCGSSVGAASEFL